jgi:RNA polymerase sigma-70 factor, ECF subfamily
MESIAVANPRTIKIEALEDVYEEHSPGLYRFAYRLLGDKQQAEDCVAETFSRFLKAVHDGRGPDVYVQAYLYKIARNWINDQFRRQPPPSLPIDTHTVIDQSDDTSDMVSLKLERERVRNALKLLTPEQRDVVILRFLEGLGHEEIASIMGKTVEATRALQSRALVALRRMLIEPEE